MCGLYGCITKTKKNDALTAEQRLMKLKIIAGLAIAMEDRGTDSTGIAALGKEMTLVKQTVKAREFVRTKAFRAAMENNPSVVIGHTRLATHGAVTKENAHPFLVGNIIGAHNGIVSNYLKIDNKVEVDSQVIFSLLDKKDNKFEKAFRKLSGSFAITWLDIRDPSSVYLVATGNPLHIVNVPELKTVFWTSTELALLTVLEATVGTEKKKIWEPKEETVYKIDGATLKSEKTKVKFKSEPYSYSNYGGYGGYYGRETIYRGGATSDSIIPAQDTITALDAEDISYEGEIAREVVYMALCGGCEQCGLPIPYKEGFWFNQANWSLSCDRCKQIADPYSEDFDYEYIDPEQFRDMQQLAATTTKRH